MAVSRRRFLQGSAALGAGVALPGLAACTPAPAGGGGGPFHLGVASGDPDPTSVVLWTRHLPPTGTDPVPVNWEVATTATFDTVVASGSTAADGERDWTVKVLATGLAAGTTYWYRFTSPSGTSAVGRTRTTPVGALDHLRLGIVSCSNFGWGNFWAYRHLANRTDLDAVVHLGDYIYEHAALGYGDTYGIARTLDPLNEIVSLGDYRRRYAWYRGDADLQELHRLNPMITIWDDHEFANDPFVGGAQNHQPATEGPWSDRVAHALRARAEWMPTRVETDVVYRTVEFGDLARLVLVDRQRRFLFPAPDDGDLYLGRAQFDWLDGVIAGTTHRWLVLAPQSTFGSINAAMSSGGWGLRDRTRVHTAVAAAGVRNLVVTVGDIHKFRAMDLPRVPGVYDATTGAGSAGVELAVGSVTSPGASDGTVGPQVRYTNGESRGYAVVDLTPDRMRADFYGFDDAQKVSPILPAEQWLAGFTSADGANHLVAAAPPT